MKIAELVGKEYAKYWATSMAFWILVTPAEIDIDLIELCHRNASTLVDILKSGETSINVVIPSGHDKLSEDYRKCFMDRLLGAEPHIKEKLEEIYKRNYLGQPPTI